MTATEYTRPQVSHVRVCFAGVELSHNHADKEIADLAVNTIRDIVRGKLPPDTPCLI
jgi:hypothetical protein